MKNKEVSTENRNWLRPVNNDFWVICLNQLLRSFDDFFGVLVSPSVDLKETDQRSS